MSGKVRDIAGPHLDAGGGRALAQAVQRRGLGHRRRDLQVLVLRAARECIQGFLGVRVYC